VTAGKAYDPNLLRQKVDIRPPAPNQ